MKRFDLATRLIATFGLSFLSLNASAYIGGWPAGDHFPATVKVATFQSSCTGVKVSDTKILLAAHCALLNVFSPRQRITISHGDGANGSAGDMDVTVASYTPHPTWKMLPSGEPYGIDLAVIETTEPISGIPNAVIDLNPVKAGESLIVGGFGCKGTQVSKSSALTQTLTAAKKIALDSPYAFFFEVGLLDANGKTKSMACSGDSGGPVYRESTDGKTNLVVGINSAENAPESLFTVDKLTGRVLRFAAPAQEGQMHLRMTRVGYDDSDPFAVVRWLKTTLPASSFLSR